jgi:hypothetical protein
MAVALVLLVGLHLPVAVVAETAGCKAELIKAHSIAVWPFKKKERKEKKSNSKTPKKKTSQKEESTAPSKPSEAGESNEGGSGEMVEC